jgi:hypothetical protein
MIPDYFHLLQGSIDSQFDAISLQGATLSQERKPSLTRSQTDSNITYAGEDIPEAQGSVCYITKDGDIDYQVVLKVCLCNQKYFIQSVDILRSKT